MRRSSNFSVTFLRLGSGVKTVELENGSTVADLLDEMNYSLGASEVVYVNEERVSDVEDVILENGDQVIISTKKDAGC